MSGSCRTYEWVMWHIWNGMNESYRTGASVLSHIWVSHVAQMSGSRRTYEWVMSHKWVGHVTHMSELCRTNKWVLSHIWVSVVARMNESCRTYEWVMPHIKMHHVAHTNESCRTCESFTCPFLVCHWPSRYMRKSYCTCVWVMSHIRMSHVAHTNESCRTYECVMSHIWMGHVVQLVVSYKYICHVTRVEESRHTLEGVVCGGYDEEAPWNHRSLLQDTVSFIGLFCQKRPIFLRSLLIVAIP